MKKCRDCKLCETYDGNMVPNKGNINSSILIVGESYTKDGIFWDHPVMVSTLNSVGLNWNNCRAEVIMRCRLPNDRRPYKEELLKCFKHTKSIASSMKLDLVISVGDMVTDILLNGASFTEGNIYWVEHVSSNKPNSIRYMVLPIYDIYQMSRAYMKDIAKFVKPIITNIDIIQDIVNDSHDGYQVRHEEYGMFQCEDMGLVYWSALSGRPDLGYYRFLTEREAKSYLQDISASFKGAMFVEPYDRKTSDKLVKYGVTAIGSVQ